MMNNENGRSMVEMLGVLAIIGVLSVAGIAGYTMAMDKYRANEILNTASMMTMIAKSANGGVGGNVASLDAAGLQAPYSGIGMVATYYAANGNVSIKVTGASDSVMKAAKAAASSTAYTLTS